VFSVGSAPNLYNEDLRQVRGDWREPLETAVEDDWEEWQRIQLRVESSAAKRRLYVCCSTAIFGVWFSETYSSCVKIRCQETATGDCNRLRTLFAAVNCKVRRLAGSAVIALSSEWCVLGVNKSNYQIHTPSKSHPYTWQYHLAAGDRYNWNIVI
jgi:hypothetical protein